MISLFTRSFAIGLLLLAMMSGCTATSPTAPYPGYPGQPSNVTVPVEDPALPGGGGFNTINDPDGSYNPGNGGNYSPGNGGSYSPDPIGNVDPGNGFFTPIGGAPVLPLTAQIEKAKNGAFLGMGKYVVTVRISNPSPVAQSGTLKLAIFDGRKSLREFNETVTVPANQSLTRTFEDPRWKADRAEVAITPLVTNVLAANPYEMASSRALSITDSLDILD